MVDAHHHLWDLSLGRHPWLVGEPIPFRYGDYAPIRRNYLVDDFRRDAAGSRLVGSVYVETEWDEDDPVGEARWAVDAALGTGVPSVVTAHAVLDGPDVEQVLDRLAATPLVRGVRHKPGGAADPAAASAHPSKLADVRWRQGFARLGALGLHLELQVAWWHLDELVDLLRAHPATPVVVNHAGLPADRSPDALRAWAAALRRVAVADEVSIKLSGIAVPGRRWTPELQRPVVEGVLDAFGPARTAFGSNFPVDSLGASYHGVLDGLLDLTSELSTPEQHDLFCGTAVRTYRIPPDRLWPAWDDGQANSGSRPGGRGAAGGQP